jgi:uncharacterized protein YdaU (DUF1376 family)
MAEKPNKLRAEWFWTDRWMGSSGFLLPMEIRGVYREMLTQAWLRGARLPNDHEAIQRAIGATAEEWARAWPKINKFWRVDGDDLVNDTQLAIYNDALAGVEKASERGRKGAQARAQARAQALAQAGAQAKPKRVLKDKPPSPSLKQTQNNEQQTEPPAPAAPRAWTVQAIDIWKLRFPEATRFEGRICKALLPLVQRLGWNVVGPDWKRYVTDPKETKVTAEWFVQHYQGPRPVGRPSSEDPPIVSQTPAARDAWANLLVALEGKVSPHPFGVWFRPTFGVTLQSDRLLVVGCDSEQIRQHIQKNFGREVSEVARSAGHPAVKFIVGRKALGT